MYIHQEVHPFFGQDLVLSMQESSTL